MNIDFTIKGNFIYNGRSHQPCGQDNKKQTSLPMVKIIIFTKQIFLSSEEATEFHFIQKK